MWTKSRYKFAYVKDYELYQTATYIQVSENIISVKMCIDIVELIFLLCETNCVHMFVNFYCMIVPQTVRFV